MCGQSAMETRREIDAARAAARASYAPMPKRDVDEMSVGGMGAGKQPAWGYWA